MDHQKVAKETLEGVGGEQNIQSVIHCATRLRFRLKDPSKADKKKVSSVSGVIQVVESGGQFQVVIGNDVSDVYQELGKIANIGEEKQEASQESDDRNILNKLIDIIAAIFTPILGVLAGAGILKGIVLVSETMEWLNPESGTYLILNAASDSMFFFLPVLLALTTARKFGGDPYVAVIIAASLLYPDIEQAVADGRSIDFFGIPVALMSYSSSVIPIILSIFVMSKLQPVLKKWIPSSLRLFTVPLILISVMVPLTMIVFGPFGTYVSSWLAAGYEFVYSSSTIIAGGIMGGLWQVLVIFGLHWGFVPLMLNNLAQNGSDTMMSIITPAIFAQSGAVLGVLLKTKIKQVKAIATPALLSGIFGITEPAIYGITLRYKRPFIIGVISATIGGAITGYAGASASSFALIGLTALPGMVGTGFGLLLVAVTISFILSAVLTYFFGFNDAMESELKEEEEKEESAPEEYEAGIVSPMTGAVLPLSDISDDAFASGAVGKGVAIIPTEGKAVAPVSGTITTVFPSKHAIGITADSGEEILVHIGLETVQLEGRSFTSRVSQGDRVEKGQTLVEFDLEAISSAGYDVASPVVVTNYTEYLDVIGTEDGNVKIGDPLLTALEQRKEVL